MKIEVISRCSACGTMKTIADNPYAICPHCDLNRCPGEEVCKLCLGPMIEYGGVGPGSKRFGQ